MDIGKLVLKPLKNYGDIAFIAAYPILESITLQILEPSLGEYLNYSFNTTPGLEYQISSTIGSLYELSKTYLKDRKEGSSVAVSIADSLTSSMSRVIRNAFFFELMSIKTSESAQELLEMLADVNYLGYIPFLSFEALRIARPFNLNRKIKNRKLASKKIYQQEITKIK